MKAEYFKDLAVSAFINGMAFLLFYLNIERMNVFILLVSAILPIAISVVISIIRNYKGIVSKKSKIIKTFLYTISNIVYLIGQKIYLDMKPEYLKSLINSTLVSSDYVNIELAENDISSILVFLILSFSLHYISFSLNKKGGVYEK